MFPSVMDPTQESPVNLLRIWQEPFRPIPRPATNPLLVPQTATDLASHYDIAISHPDVHMPPFAAFEGWLARAAAERGLSCALLHNGVVQEAIQRLAWGTLTIGYYVDYFALWHVAGDPYARLAHAVQDAG